MNSSILGAALGMAVIFAAFALLASGLQEVIASSLKLRGQTLITALERLGEGEAAEILNSSVLKPLGKEKASAVPDGNESDKTVNKKDVPSYIPSWLFAASVVGRIPDTLTTKAELVKDAGDAATPPPPIPDELANLPGALGNVVRKIWADVGGDVEKVQHELARWYDSYMERVSGWYKRKTRWILFFVGLLVCVIANVDAISLTRTVVDNAQVQAVLNTDATNTKACPAGSSQLECGINAISSLPGSQLGLFWVAGCTPKAAATASKGAISSTKVVVCTNGVGGWFHNRGVRHFGDYVIKLLGLILGAFAISLGAPFWFDLIGRGVALKGAGQTPDPAKPTPSTT